MTKAQLMPSPHPGTPKPPGNAPRGLSCVHCGYCCRKATCAFGVAAGAGVHDCHFLIHEDDLWWCALARMSPTYARHIGTGTGCSSLMNSDRQRIIQAPE